MSWASIWLGLFFLELVVISWATTRPCRLSLEQGRCPICDAEPKLPTATARLRS